LSRRSRGLWTDAEALQRLARARQRASADDDQAPVRPESAELRFPPFDGERRFRLHVVEAPLTLASGDYTDAFLVSDRDLVLVMADVSGKGVGAAVLQSVTRSVVRTLAPDLAGPADLLARLEKFLFEAELGAMYLTIFIGRLDPQTGDLRYANAGHPVPYVVGGDARVERFGQVTGPILGILGTERFAEGRERLRAGDRLVLYTDGVTEASSPNGEFFGEGRLERILSENAASSLEDVGSRILDGVRLFRGPSPQDDLSVLLLELTERKFF
jgi:sigma-B regulation protein RsbU (phosphoserine phosphatase)